MIENVPTSAVLNSNTDIQDAKERDHAKIHWFFSLKAEDITEEYLSSKLKKISINYNFQKEMGTKTGYIHYQGYIHLKKKLRMSTLKKDLWTHIHLEACRNIDACEQYCQKSETRIGEPVFYPEKVIILKESELYQWQQNIVNIVKGKPDKRIIFWFVDYTGGKGKTELSRYLVHTFNAIYIDCGQRKDILYYCAEAGESNVYVFDFVRSVEGRISYSAIESIKNGLYFAPKYKSTTISRNPPHIIIFSNFFPDMNQLSTDRWNITDLSVAPLHSLTCTPRDSVPRVLSPSATREASPPCTNITLSFN